VPNTLSVPEIVPFPPPLGHHAPRATSPLDNCEIATSEFMSPNHRWRKRLRDGIADSVQEEWRGPTPAETKGPKFLPVSLATSPVEISPLYALDAEERNSG
jgi:hypothetical protein